LVGVVRVARTREAAGVLLPWLLGPPLLVSLLGLVTGITYEVRYTVAALPAFTLVLAAGICTLPRPGLRIGAGGALAVRTPLANHYWNPRYAKEDVRGAIADARASDPDAPFVVIGQARAAVWFYAKNAPIETLEGCEPNVPGPNPAQVAALVDAPVLWAVVSR